MKEVLYWLSLAIGSAIVGIMIGCYSLDVAYICMQIKKGFNMRKLILRWLFGTDNIDEYTELLGRVINELESHQKTIYKNLEDLEEHRETLDTVRKLIVICKNHGIDVDKEIKNIEL